jgi:flagellar biosynthesis/type III secretory pathway chaperone
MSARTLAPTIPTLCRLLDREEAACQTLLETVLEERAAIRNLAVTEFHPINCKRLVVLESLQTLAQEREALVRHIAMQHALGSTTTIHNLIDLLAAPESIGLRERYNSFISIVKMLRAEIKHNVVLLEGIRGDLDQALSAGATIAPGFDVYNGDGQRSRAATANLLIHQQG